MNRNQMISEIREFMANARFQWAVCGGFALDLFLDKDTRMHGDIDICVFERDREAILRYMLQKDWNVYEFRGQGKVRLLKDASSSEPGRNLMCVKEICDIVKFYPSEDEEILYHQFFHTGIRKLNYLEYLFNSMDGACLVFDREGRLKRELSSAILFRDGIPYLAPEIVLLYKASNPENADYQFDFEQAYVHMSDDQKEWFLHGIDVLYPDGHIWKSSKY